jgi:hypothetical protein
MPESDPRRFILELIGVAPGDGVSQQRLLSQGANPSHLADLVDEGLVMATSGSFPAGRSALV